MKSFPLLLYLCPVDKAQIVHLKFETHYIFKSCSAKGNIFKWEVSRAHRTSCRTKYPNRIPHNTAWCSMTISARWPGYAIPVV